MRFTKFRLRPFSRREDYNLFGMKKEQLARELARESRISQAAAADEVDRIVSEILKKIRSGQNASLPGLGTFRPTFEREIAFERERDPTRRKRATR